MKKRFSEEQIIGFLQQAEAGVWFGAAVEVEAMAVETPG